MACKAEYCVYCFDVLLENLSSHPKAVLPAVPEDPFPLFVTWKKWHAEEKDWALRGCIGTFSPKKLDVGLKDYALTSALRDSRFTPMQAKEIPSLSCTVSLLTDFEECSRYDDWEVGVHGITIDFKDSSNRSYSATYLPEVALEQGWTKDECVDSLMRKAGFKGQATKNMKSAISTTRYQSSLHTLTYNEYEQHKRDK